MKILYTGIEDDGLTYGGEYEVLRSIPRPNGICYVVVNDNGTEAFIQNHNARSTENEPIERLLNGEWVETDEVQKALGITFAEGLRRFEFSRTAEWWSIVGKTEEERARNGQKIETYFRLRNEEA